MAEIEHEVFDIFRSGIDSVNKTLSDLIDVKNNIFYLYDLNTGNVLVTNSNSFGGLSDYPPRYKVFHPRTKVYGTAKILRASEDNLRSAVVTEVGLYIMDTPFIRTSLMMPPDSNTFTVSPVWMVPPELEKMPNVFVYKVLQVRWHPRLHHYIVALYNDNYLRLLNTLTQTLHQTLSLGRHPDFPLSTVIALNEHTVDFDFAPVKKNEASAFPCNRSEVSLFVLTGLGDVSQAVISCGKSSLDKPMRFKWEMKSRNPSISIRNASSLIVLPTCPTVLVLGTKNGFIRHCVILREDNKQKLKVFEQWTLDSGEKNSRGRQEEELNDLAGRDRTYILKKDPGSNYRYCVLDEAGVYVVMLPLMPVIAQSLAQHQRVGKELEEKLRTAIRETASIVRHVVNTQVDEQTEPRPPFGLGMIQVQVIGSKLVILLADCQATAHQVDAMFPPITDYLPKPAQTVKEPSKPFSVVVGNYLLGSKSSKPPVVKVGDSMMNAPLDEVLQFLRIYFNNLKGSRLRKHNVVTELIDTKIRDNIIEYDCQLKQLNELIAAKESLKQNAERIAERYEETNEKHVELQKRLEMIGLKINAPGRTVAEDKMKLELVVMKHKAQNLQTALFQTQALFEHRNAQDPNQKVEESKDKKIHLSETRKVAIRQSLVSMSENIEEITERINCLKSKVDAMEQSENPHLRDNDEHHI